MKPIRLQQLLILFIFSIGFSIFSHAQTSGVEPVEPSVAKTYLSEYWENKRVKVENFAVDQIRFESMKMIMSQPEADQIVKFRFYRGVRNGEDIALVVGANSKVEDIGKYYVSALSKTIGPCPTICD